MGKPRRYSTYMYDWSAIPFNLANDIKFCSFSEQLLTTGGLKGICEMFLG